MKATIGVRTQSEVVRRGILLLENQSLYSGILLSLTPFDKLRVSDRSGLRVPAGYSSPCDTIDCIHIHWCLLLLTQRSHRLLLWGTIAAFVLLVATACAPLERLQLLRRGQVPSQVPQELSTVWEVWQILEKDYGGRESIDQRRLSEGAIQGMLETLGDREPAYLSPDDYDLDTPDLGAVWQAWRVLSLEMEGADTGVTSQELQGAAIRGMLDALGNRHMSYLLQEDYEMELRSLKSNFEGIGVYVNILDDQLTVVLPIPDTPAERAGIITGDVILEVDGTPTAGLSLTQAAARISGPRGTSVDLLMLHPDQETPQTITVIRGTVKRQSVHWQPVGDDLAYLWIMQFLDDTDEDVEEALQEIMSQGFEGLILDIRRNPGGLVTTLVAVASQFLKDGLVLYQVDGQGKRTDVSVREGGMAREIPMVVLTDLFSASASEILAGALQDHQRATVIGTRTFGKGSVNEFRELRDGSGLYLVAALWYTPEGRLIEGDGLPPDIVVPMDLRIPLLSPLDWQLGAAVDYLQAQIPAPVG